ncbi:putative DNA primase/helicase [Proteiniborus ethanoligenes]|uniref:Putative DNA primase/helicase n=1 Tax=Proteiniborus ethanoligenes TaxID=415015 RepID=A0A1H3SR56_9FIRM|nr:phage/plasmid primase, P4 family [Proteiniborus ethanoligenes]SDZ40055.1 putative DNA primase/helicase [Proteiniborus ethanoligenes]
MKYNIEDVLSKLTNVRQSSENQWTARCPAHNDDRNSLSIGKGDDGKVLLHCFAGCVYKAILSALDSKEIKAKAIPAMQDKVEKRISAVYSYVDERNELLFQVVRTEPKGFYQRRPDGKGGWINGLKEVRRVIYNLPHVLEAVKNQDQILIVEGEKDANRLCSLGFVATTTPMGASNWKEEYSKFFKQANVAIIPDNDSPGRRYVQKVAESITKKGAKVKIINLPGLSEKEDVSDWLDKGNTKEQLIQLINEKLAYTPIHLSGKVQEQIEIEGFPCTDLGNAERLVAMFGDDIRYCYEAKSWLIWKGTRWEWDETGEIERKAKETVRSIYGEAMGEEDRGRRKDLAEWAKESESKRAIKAMIDLAKSEKGIPIRRSELDKNDWLLNCLNGIIDLKTGQLRKHSKEDYITLLAPVLYNSNAKSEIFDKFINRILPDEELREFIQIAAGYSMTGDTSEEKLFFAYGPPATGKSTLFAAIKSALGDYTATTDFETFLERKGNSGPRNDIARLAGKRFVLGSEVDEGKKLAESLVKQITGNDTITARFLHQEFFEFQPKMKLWLAANFRPRVNANDDAMWRRILQAPFTVHIPKEERDPNLKKFLSNPEQGGPVILAWLVEGCLKWQREGLKVPKIVEDFTAEYKEEMDPLKDFFIDCCVINPLAKANNTQLWEEYENWCRDNGEKFPLGRKKFKQRLESKGFIQERTGSARWWKGIGLKNNKEMTGVTRYDSRKDIKDKTPYNRDEILEQTSHASEVSQKNLELKTYFN